MGYLFLLDKLKYLYIFYSKVIICILLSRRGVTRVGDAISGPSKVSVAPEQICSDLAGETVILNLKTGMYYGLNALGTRIWELIQEPRSVDAIRDTLVEEYEVEPERCERDLLTLLQEMAAEGMIRVQDGANS